VTDGFVSAMGGGTGAGWGRRGAEMGGMAEFGGSAGRKSGKLTGLCGGWWIVLAMFG
jgi:hypothetical protein